MHFSGLTGNAGRLQALCGSEGVDRHVVGLLADSARPAAIRRTPQNPVFGCKWDQISGER
jgi:hypothetical protein